MQTQDNPTSGNILVANVRAPAFSGILNYQFMKGAPANATDPMDQRMGDWVTQTNTAVGHYATGTRNPYGIKVGLKGNVMVTINGPNFKFGAQLTGIDANSEPMLGPDPETDDAVFINLKEVRYCFLFDVFVP
jgi:hypothetical protein